MPGLVIVSNTTPGTPMHESVEAMKRLQRVPAKDAPLEEWERFLTLYRAMSPEERAVIHANKEEHKMIILKALEVRVRKISSK